MLFKGNITITGARASAAARNADEKNNQVTFKFYAPFADCISEINNTQVDSFR